MAQGPAKTILVIEDDDTVSEFLQILLTRDGFHVIAVDNAISALNHLKANVTQKVDLVISDLMMPRMGGYDFVKELQQPGYKKVPVCILTSRELDLGTIELIRMESNVCEFLHKPIDPGHLKETVYRLLDIPVK